MKTKTEWFNEYGHFMGELPEECVSDCTAPGQDASPMVAHWRKRLGFEVPRARAIEWLAEYGAWPRATDESDEGLEDMSDEALAEKVLWIACGDLREQGEWFGLVH